MTVLTDTQLTELTGYMKAWAGYAACTEPADRPRAQAAIKFMYKQAGLDTPHIIWTKDPFIGPVAYALINLILKDDSQPAQYPQQFYGDLKPNVDLFSTWDRIDPVYLNSGGGAIKDAVKRMVRRVNGRGESPQEIDNSLMATFYEMRENGGCPVMNRFMDTAKEVAWGYVKDRIDLQSQKDFWDPNWEAFRFEAWETVRMAEFSIAGQDDAFRLAYFEYLNDIGELSGFETLKGNVELCKSAGWVMAYDDICFISERHDAMNLDEAGLLHCGTGPALSYRDGFRVYEWHGNPYPSEWAYNKPNAAEALSWTNLELRRVVCEMIGWASILEQLKAVTINKDKNPEIGELLQAEIPKVGIEKFLRVTCGTGREFILSVPPDMKTAREANAWTWGLEAFEYNPEVRT